MAPDSNPIVLLVDNEPLVRAVLAEVLRQGGFEVRTAGSGTEAVEMAGHTPPSLVLMDVQMPGLSGWETLDRLREAQPSLPVLMMSGADFQDEALARGATGFVSKPYRPVEVLQDVREALHLAD